MFFGLSAAFGRTGRGKGARREGEVMYQFNREEYDKRMEWYRDARFGMFIHWGLYSIPARGEWIRSTEEMTKEEYQKYFEEFDARDFNPKEWARMAKEAGMKYMVLTAKHHDGFCLFDSKYTEYKATNTKAGRDLVREFLDAFRAEGLKVGLYFTLIDWHHPDYPKYNDMHHPMRGNEAYKDENINFDRYLEYMHGQVEELVTNYGKLDILWFDFSYDNMCEDTWKAEELIRMVRKHQPDIIVPEIEAIRTERLYHLEQEGIQVVPSARAVNFTMNRKAIRDLAAKELGLKTAKYFYAKSLEELQEAAKEIGFPCVVKPLMSSSGKGQSLVKSADELEQAWHYGCEGSRGDIKELIIEEFIQFDSEITLLTVTQKNGPTLFCPPIGHVQKGGDYRESFQPAHIDPEHLKEAQRMADKVTAALTGAGIWGVEFFLSHENGVYFSELSPRPHDTGMVTLAGTQNLNEFELHLRAVLGLPIPEITQERIGASAVILSPIASKEAPRYRGEEEVCKETNTYLRIFW